MNKACKLDVDKVVRQVVQKEVKHITAISESGFAEATYYFNNKDVEAIKELNKRFKEEVVVLNYPTTSDTNKYIQIKISEDLYTRYMKAIDIKRGYNDEVETSITPELSEVQKKFQEKLEAIQEIFNQNPELSKIGDVFSYAIYLDNIFPDSKVKDIVYHGTHTKFDKFDKSLVGSKTRATIKGKGFFFSNSSAIAQGYRQSLDNSNIYNDVIFYYYFKRDLGNKNIDTITEKELQDIVINYFGNEDLNVYYLQNQSLEKTKALFKKFKNDKQFDTVNYSDELDFSKYIKDDSIVYSVILDSRNPLIVEGNNYQMLSIVKKEIEKLKDNNDSIIFNNVEDGIAGGYRNVANTYTVFEPEQIHILGSKQDVEGFKNWAANNQSKPGVSESFDENPELAQSVYEALGFNKTSKISQEDSEKIDKIFKKYPELAVVFNNNKELYNSYLESIFSNASEEFKGKLFFHGTKNPIEGGKFKITDRNLAKGLWFTKQLSYAKRIQNYAAEGDNPYTYGVVLNIKNPKHFYNSSGALLVQRPSDFEKQYNREKNDAVVFHHPESSDGKFTNKGGYNQIVVFDENQVHIIGDENDLSKAKEFLNNQITPQQKATAQQLYSQYLEQNPNGNIEGFKEFVGKDGKIENNINLNVTQLELFTINELAEQGVIKTIKC